MFPALLGLSQDGKGRVDLPGTLRRVSTRVNVGVVTLQHRHPSGSDDEIFSVQTDAEGMKVIGHGRITASYAT